MQHSCFPFATKYTTILHSKTLNEWSWLYTETLDSALQEAIHRGQQLMVSKPAAMKNLRIPVSLARESKAWYRLESVLEKKRILINFLKSRIQYPVEGETFVEYFIFLFSLGLLINKIKFRQFLTSVFINTALIHFRDYEGQNLIPTKFYLV